MGKRLDLLSICYESGTVLTTSTHFISFTPNSHTCGWALLAPPLKTWKLILREAKQPAGGHTANMR